MRAATGTVVAVVAAWLVGFLINLTIAGAVIWTAVHFIRKWW